MKIAFYDTRITDDYHMVLVEEKALECDKKSITNSADVAEMMQLLEMDKLGEEHCYLLALNTKGMVLGIFLLSKGTIDMSLLGIREIYIRALLAGASRIILCHNHPSKDCTPSEKDIVNTKKVKDAGDIMGVELLDHIVIGGPSYFSFREQNML